MTDSWRDQILKHFIPQVARLTLVADPDNLMLDEGVLQDIREQGYELIAYEDHITFRFNYESKFRSLWDRGESMDTCVVVRTDRRDLATMPYDLLHAGRQLSFGLSDLFPNFSYPVIAALDRRYVDDLYKAQIDHSPGTLGDNATREFILRHVFGVTTEVIKGPSDLLSVLLRRHFRNESVPSIVDEIFIKILRRSDVFKDWPLDEIVPDRDSFFAFLQERWPIYLDLLSTSDAKVIHDNKLGYHLEYSDPINIPFEHKDVRVYMDNLFSEGLLQPVSHDQADKLSKTWVSVGLKIDPESDCRRRLEALMASIDSTMPAPDARYQDWLTFAYRWAELVVLMCKEDGKTPADMLERFQILQGLVDSAFLSWCEKHYSGLHNQPSVPPVMVHHIPRALARQMDDLNQSKIAMIVIDGLALDQWLIIKDVLSNQRSDLLLHENAVYAWIPTITSVSRQALFSGKLPLYFPESIHTTAREQHRWTQFWLDHGLNKGQIVYLRGLGDKDAGDVQEQLSVPGIQVAGLVVDTVDKIMHGMELGTAGMHNQVRQWASQGYMANLIELLHEMDFGIWLTSDHGNIEARGSGSPFEGKVADLRGERARVYPSEILRTQIKQKFPEAIEWAPYGLPDDFLPLLAPGRTAFTKKGDRTVGHGGISLEEVIVPLVEVRWKKT